MAKFPQTSGLNQIQLKFHSGEVTKETLNYPDILSAIAVLTGFFGRDGIALEDRPKNAREKPYELALYEHWKRLAEGDSSAQEGWVLPPKEIFNGKKPEQRKVTVTNNLVSQLGKVPDDAMLEWKPYNSHYDQEYASGKSIDKHPDLNKYWTCTEKSPKYAWTVTLSGAEPWVGGIANDSYPHEKEDKKFKHDKFNARLICMTFK